MISGKRKKCGKTKRNKLRELYGDDCYYCKCTMNFQNTKTDSSATIEHLISAFESDTGKRVNRLEHLRLACRKCNGERNLKVHRDIGLEGVYRHTLDKIKKKITADLPIKQIERLERQKMYLQSKLN